MVQSDIEAAFQPYLHSGERLTWTGRPAQGLRLSPRDALLVPFSLLWGGFAIFWESEVLKTSAPTFFALWGVPFVAGGLFMIFGRFFADAWIRARTIYALTGERALVLRGGFGVRLLATSLGGSVRVSGQRDGTGTLEFGAKGDLISGMRSWTIWMPSLGSEVRFIGIPDVMQAYQLSARGGP